MSARYVRQAYGIDYKAGERVIVDGKPGVIVSFPDQYLGVRFDGEKRTTRCHPTWRVERTGIRFCTAPLPNCDRCGRFTSKPTLVDNSWTGGSGMFFCSELLFCPRCMEGRL